MERMLEIGNVLLFSQFSFLPETNFNFPVRFILSSAIPLDVGRSKTSLYGKKKTNLDPFNTEYINSMAEKTVHLKSK